MDRKRAFNTRGGDSFMKPIKIIVVAGARPNFMKVSPLLKRIAEFNARRDGNAVPLAALLVHTGQHYDANMSEVFFQELGIRRPDINLGVGSGSHAVQTAHILTSFETVCETEKPDWVVVVGDVNSTMGCTLVCAKMGIRVAHIEAGLRSFDRTMPEEINRLVTDALADMLLIPSADAGENLLREGAAADKIKFVGNIMIDSLLDNLAQARSSGILAQLKLEPSRFVYVTLHRPANVDERGGLSTIWTALKRLSRVLPVVCPVHPRTRKKLEDFGLPSRSDARFSLSDRKREGCSDRFRRSPRGGHILPDAVPHSSAEHGKAGHRDDRQQPLDQDRAAAGGRR